MRRMLLLGMSMIAALMLGGTAQAADMPVKAPLPAAPVMYNWTGFYIGAHIGGAWFDGNGHDRFDPNFHCLDKIICFDDNGFGHNNGRFIGGGQIGYNYQVSQWVWGIEGQISGLASNDDDQACGFFATTTGGPRDFLFRCRERSGWIASIAARLGVTFGQTGNWLLYVKGGGAFADANFGLRFRDDCHSLPINFSVVCDSGAVFNNNNDTRTGWMIGVGLEYGAWGNWSWKLEYNHMDFGNRDIHFDNTFPTLCVGCRLVRDIDFDRQINVVKFGLNYRFAPAAAPVAARY